MPTSSITDRFVLDDKGAEFNGVRPHYEILKINERSRANI